MRSEQETNGQWRKGKTVYTHARTHTKDLWRVVSAPDQTHARRIGTRQRLIHPSFLQGKIPSFVKKRTHYERAKTSSSIYSCDFLAPKSLPSFSLTMFLQEKGKGNLVLILTADAFALVFYDGGFQHECGIPPLGWKLSPSSLMASAQIQISLKYAHGRDKPASESGFQYSYLPSVPLLAFKLPQSVHSRILRSLQL